MKNGMTKQNEAPHDKPNLKRVVIVGAGISGLAAARELIERRYDVLILEARRRPGGRLKTVPVGLQHDADGGGGSARVVKKEPLARWGDGSDNGSVTTTKSPKSVLGKHSLGDDVDDDSPSPPSTSSDVALRSQRYDVGMAKRDDLCLVDVGGQFVHGVDGGRNPIAELAHKLGVTCMAVGKSDKCLLLNDAGWPLEYATDHKIETKFNECLELAHDACNGGKPVQVSGEATAQQSKKRSRESGEDSDCGGGSNPMNEKGEESFGDIFYRVSQSTLSSLTDAERDIFNWHIANLEMSCGTDLNSLGKRWNDDECYGFDGDHVILREGFGAVISGLARGTHVRYGTEVQSVTVVPPPQKVKEHRSSAVAAPPPSRRSARIQELHSSPILYEPEEEKHDSEEEGEGERPQSRILIGTNNGTFECDAVIITVPLGVLKDCDGERIRFDPPLPPRKKLAIQRLGFGVLNKCVMTFETKFWADVDFIGHCSERHGENILLFNVRARDGQDSKPWIEMLFGGAYAQQMERLSDKRIVSECCAILQKCSGLKHPPEPIDHVVTRWQSDPYARGAFAYIPPGVSGEEHEHLASPILDPVDVLRQSTNSSTDEKLPPRPIVLFAGEATTSFHPSTIHGAYLSGIREAYRLDLSHDPTGNDFTEFDHECLYKRTFQIRRLLTPPPSSHSKKIDQKHDQQKNPAVTPLHTPIRRRAGLRSRDHVGKYRQQQLDDSKTKLSTQQQFVPVESGQNRSSRRTTYVKSYSCMEDYETDEDCDSKAAAPDRFTSSVVNGIDLKKQKSSPTNRVGFTSADDIALLRGVDSYGMDLKGLNIIRQKNGFE